MPGFRITGYENDSKTLAKVEPVFSHRFRVDISNMGNTVCSYALSCQRPSYSFDIIDIPYKSTTIHTPGKIKWEPITIIFYELIGEYSDSSATAKAGGFNVLTSINNIKSKINDVASSASSVLNGSIGGKYVSSINTQMTSSASTTHTLFNLFVNNQLSGYNYSDNRLNTEFLIDYIKIYIDDGGSILPDNVSNGIVSELAGKIPAGFGGLIAPGKYTKNSTQIAQLPSVYTLHNVIAQNVVLGELNYESSRILTTAVTFVYDSATESAGDDVALPWNANAGKSSLDQVKSLAKSVRGLF